MAATQTVAQALPLCKSGDGIPPPIEHTYPFERFGYQCKSIPLTYFGPFLGYKIERGVFPGFESDTLLSLNSISTSVVPLDECEVEERKLSFNTCAHQSACSNLLRSGGDDIFKNDTHAARLDARRDRAN